MIPCSRPLTALIGSTCNGSFVARRSGPVRLGASRWSLVSVAIALRMVVADDVLERRLLRERMGRQQTGHDRRLDASAVEPTCGPITCDRQVVERHVEWRQTVLHRARQ